MSGQPILNFNNPSIILNSRFLPTASTSKHVVVLLHAFPFSSVMWERMAAHLQFLRDDTSLLLIDFSRLWRINATNTLGSLGS
jgi:pimeloyl-ACP methyl ester carboxylesterase